MKVSEFQSAFGLPGRVLGVLRSRDGVPSKGPEVFRGRCTLTSLHYAMEGHTVWLKESNSPCKGGLVGLGLRDGLPDIPGGFGFFISSGRGEGFPPGERLKSCPETGEQMILSQPQGVMEGYEELRIKPYEDGDEADTVILFCDADQLGAMIFLFNYSKSGTDYDTVIAPAAAGCASLFRIPFGELKRPEPRAVIGLTDINARIHFDSRWLSFTVSKREFQRMLRDADDSFVKTQLWAPIAQRRERPEERKDN